jgi:hypothetical protein
VRLAPFWRYYGGKNRSARLYPPPRHEHIIEPFAGAAGYACNYPDRQVTLIDRSPVVAGVWRFLIGSKPEDILAIPDVPHDGTVDDLDVCQEARWLVGFWLNSGTARPRKRRSTRARREGMSAPNWTGWGDRSRNRIAQQLWRIAHWNIIEGDYTDAPDVEATWFIDPPYDNKAGRYYPCQPDSFEALGAWCRGRRGSVIVCEQAGADWLPFAPLADVKSNHGKSREVMYWQRGAA